MKAANLARYFPPWTVTRSQWSEMTRPEISGVAIDTLLFSRIGLPLFHRYRIVSHTGTHAAMSAATVTIREVDVHPGPSRVWPLPRLGLASISVGQRVPAVVLPFTPRSVPTLLIPRGDGGLAVPLSVPPDFPTPSSSLTSSGQSATPSSQMMAWGDVSDSSVPLSPNRVRAGHSQDVPEDGSLFHVSPVSPGFLTRTSRDAPQFPLEGCCCRRR